MLNAAAFRIFGTTLRTLRLPLFILFLLWVPALYYLATRFAAPAVAGLVTFLGVAWSLPQYREAMPSWYNLFCATFGTAALLRYLETNRQRWLFVAGLAGGLSCIVKITGLYFVAGGLLFLLYREAMIANASSQGSRLRWHPYALIIGTGLVTFVALLGWLVHSRLAIPEVVHFVLPGGMLAAFVYGACARSDRAAAGHRLVRLSRLVWPFLAGVAVPIATFLVPYVGSGAVGTFLVGTLVVPMRRLDAAASPLPGVATLFAAVPVAVLLGLLPWPTNPAGRALRWVMMVAVVAFLVLSHHPVWYAIRPLLPLIVGIGLWDLARGRMRLPALRSQQVFLVLSVTALCSLVQFPFARPIYFFYIAPLVAIATLAVFATRERPLENDAVPAALLGSFLVFSIVDTHPTHDHLEPLALERGGITVPARDRAVYESLVTLVRAHASGGYVYAAPDCPQVYFLANLRNPTRTIWDFLADSSGNTQRILRALDDRRVMAVVINRRPPFSAPLSADLVDSLALRYPQADSVGWFVVRWRP